MKLFVTLIGLILVIEGIPYVLSPEGMQKWLREVATMPPRLLRAIGLTAMALGLLLCYLTQRTGWLG
jgi:hypothetical protein